MEGGLSARTNSQTKPLKAAEKIAVFAYEAIPDKDSGNNNKSCSQFSLQNEPKG
jgi:hypothetical protein